MDPITFTSTQLKLQNASWHEHVYKIGHETRRTNDDYIIFLKDISLIEQI